MSLSKNGMMGSGEVIASNILIFVVFGTIESHSQYRKKRSNDLVGGEEEKAWVILREEETHALTINFDDIIS